MKLLQITKERTKIKTKENLHTHTQTQIETQNQQHGRVVYAWPDTVLLTVSKRKKLERNFHPRSIHGI